jgi:hypothetical protein
LSLADLYFRHAGKVSDKWSSYLEVYTDLFGSVRFQPVRMLEIGVQNGGSLELWNEFFPNAEMILGCDIDPRCGKLEYASGKIEVIVGDAATPAVQAQIAMRSAELDIVIDDGSHRSEDIIRNFARYFPTLAPGGIYVIEDLHCSYWKKFGGGLDEPASAMAFLKHLCDAVNFEHWGNQRSVSEPLAKICEKHGAAFADADLRQVGSISFHNSMAIIRKHREANNSIGTRVVKGTDARVQASVIGLNGSTPGEKSREPRLAVPKPANDQHRYLAALWARLARAFETA